MWRLEKGKRFTQLYPSIRAYSELVGRTSSESRRGAQKLFTFADNRARDAAITVRVRELEAAGWVVVQNPQGRVTPAPASTARRPRRRPARRRTASR